MDDDWVYPWLWKPLTSWSYVARAQSDWPPNCMASFSTWPCAMCWLASIPDFSCQSYLTILKATTTNCSVRFFGWNCHFVPVLWMLHTLSSQPSQEKNTRLRPSCSSGDSFRCSSPWKSGQIGWRNVGKQLVPVFFFGCRLLQNS